MTLLPMTAYFALGRHHSGLILDKRKPISNPCTGNFPHYYPYYHKKGVCLVAIVAVAIQIGMEMVAMAKGGFPAMISVSYV